LHLTKLCVILQMKQVNMLNIHLLESFLPLNTLPLIEQWVKDYPLRLVISKSRKSKYGDYRYLFDRKAHKITINHDLSAEMFLLTLTHEIAHMYVFKTYQRKALPHGKEWKETFKKLIFQSIQFYSQPVQKELVKYAKNPSATLGAHPELIKKMIEKKHEQFCYLENLREGEWFVLSKKILKKGKLRRTRFLCKEHRSGREYLVYKAAQVERHYEEGKLTSSKEPINEK